MIPGLAPVLPHITDIVAVKGHGAYLYDTRGRRYLDFTSGIGVTNTGHCHPRVVDAIREQAGRLLHAQINVVYQEPMIALIGELRRVVPEGLRAELDWDAWERPPVFHWLGRHVDEEEARRVFNLGIGFCAVVAAAEPGELVIGRIVEA